jgi:hypothetical protein
MAELRNTGGQVSVARVFTQQPNRVAAAWRRVRYSLTPRNERENLLDDVVESFVRELGYALSGREGSPWSRSKGVLKISPARGPHALFDEFAALRRCLNDALDVLGGGQGERLMVNAALDEAVDSAVALCRKLEHPGTPGPQVPFGGLVVEIFERPKAPISPVHDAVTPPVH